MSRKNLTQLIMALRKVPQERRKRAKEFIPFMILQMRDEDLKKLGEEYQKNWIYILMAMLLFPKERWKELGIPDYLMKYEIEDEEEEDEDW